MKWNHAIAASIAALIAPAAATAATVYADGVTVNIYRQANTGNTGGTADAVLGNIGPANFLGRVSYTGALDFDTQTQDADTATIDDWLTSKGGSYVETVGFDEDLTISSPDIDDNSALTTWFEFLGVGAAFSFSVTHDDGFCFYENGAQEICSPDPTVAITTPGGNYGGGLFQLVYAATNGDPSVLLVEGDGRLTAVPLPAGLPLLLAGLGGLALLRRRSA